MPGVTTAYQSGVHGSLPAAGSGCILYACSTHAKVYRSDGSTWTDWLVISAGMTNPLTTTGDLIYSSSGTTPARLAVGGANTVLHGGASVPAYSAVLPADLDVSADNTTADATTGHHGLLPKLGGGSTNFLRADGTWNAPAGGGGTFVGAKAYMNTTQAVTAGADRVLTFNTEEWDSDGFHDNVTNNGRMTVPTGKGGKYSCTAHLYNVSSGSDVRFRVNGSALFADIWVIGGAGVGVTISADLALAVGDYVEVCIYPGGSITLGSASAHEAMNDFSVSFLGA